MRNSSKLLRTFTPLIVCGALAHTCFGQTGPRILPVPPDPFELVNGQVQVADTAASREAALQLLSRSRNRFASRGKTAYGLKISFTADSQGQTDYDGAWEMEDSFVPGQGHRWTAKAAAGYVTSRIFSTAGSYGEGTASSIPLRLHEARGLLLDPLPSADHANLGSIRTAAVTYRGAALTCILLSTYRQPANPATGRGWDENEECIDPQSGLLQVHSEVPGRYAVYDYGNAPRLGNRVLPRGVSVVEAGRIVSKISVDSFTELIAPEPSLLVPTSAMTTAGHSTGILAIKKVTRVHGAAAATSAMTVRTVCVFGVITPTGKLAEAHSLQPDDPNSNAALDDAKQIDFSPATNAGAPAQRFVFVIEKFVSPE